MFPSSADGECVVCGVVESASSNLGRRIGTNADLTTSIGSSSESESCRSMDEFSLWWCDEDVGLLELGLDEETGDNRDDSLPCPCPCCCKG